MYTYVKMACHKIFRKQCILQDYIHQKLYKKKKKWNYTCLRSIFIYIMYAAHSNCAVYGKVNGFQDPL